MTTLILLHPGAMGAAVGAQAVTAGHQVLWVPEGRSAATSKRAEAAGLEACGSLAEALQASDIALSICPPQAAESVAGDVARQGFTGVYVDANAVSPSRVKRIAGLLPADCTVVDGSIFGPPPSDEKTTRLYLAPDVGSLTPVFEGTAVHVVQAGTEFGSASALKMAFASFQKSARTLSGVAHALAHAHGVDTHLTVEAGRMASDILEDSAYLPSVAARGWRWAAEMKEIAATLRASGLPTELAEATVAVLSRWEQDKDNTTLSLDAVLAHLRDDTD